VEGCSHQVDPLTSTTFLYLVFRESARRKARYFSAFIDN